MSSKDTGKTHVVHPKNHNIIIMIGNNTNEIINGIFS